MKKIKKFLGITLSTLLSVVPMCQFASAAFITPEYAITKNRVIIDHVSYKINDNKIVYNGLTYEIEDNMLVSYDDNIVTLFVLPIEENKITDSREIAKLNATVNSSSGVSRATTSYVSVPYEANVAEGKTQITTPTFKMHESGFRNLTYLKLNNFSSLSGRKFLITISMKLSDGTWATGQKEYSFVAPLNAVRFQNISGMEYGRFTIKNLNGNPSPSYTYRIFFN